MWGAVSGLATKPDAPEIIKDPICTPLPANQSTIFEHITSTHLFNKTITKHITECVTETVTFNETETEFDTVHITETGTDTVIITETGTETETDTVHETETETDSITETETQTQTQTETEIETTTSIETVFSTSYDPCPSLCSVDADTVTVMYWPTDRPHDYPETYVDTDLDYTFKSPSVYLIIPSAKGTNTKGEWVGPTTTNWILPLDISEVSTIADGPTGSLTRQLQLKDLGTKCAQSMNDEAIKTLSDPHCAPILAAPSQVKEWAHPCNACGRLGLFDPPYAIPTATGGLIDSTKATKKPDSTPAAISSTEVPEPEPSTEDESTETLSESQGGDVGEKPTKGPTVAPVPTDQPTTTEGAEPIDQPEPTEGTEPTGEPEAPTVLPGPGDGEETETEGGDTAIVDAPTEVPTPANPDTAGVGRVNTDGSILGAIVAVAAVAAMI